MKILRKVSVTLFLTLAFSIILSFSVINADAASYGNFTYTVSGTRVTITDVNETASGEITVPEKIGTYTVTAIGRYAFHNCSDVTGVTLPETVTSVGEYAFMNCLSLEYVNLPAGCTTLGGSMFLNCTSLTEITLPSAITSVPSSCFGSCISLYRIVIPDSVKTFGYGAFKNCINLKEVVIGENNSVKTIGEDAFYGCTSLRSFVIPKGVTKLYSGGFSQCTSLESIVIPKTVTVIPASFLRGCTSLNTVTFDEGTALTLIENYAFYGCASLYGITLPGNITSIGKSAFEGCKSLYDVEIETGSARVYPTTFADTGFFNDETCWDDGILYMDGYIISAKKDITGNIVIRNGTRAIADEAFLGCKVKTVYLPEGITRIPGSAFENCSLMTHIYVPEGVTYIGGSAFMSCTSLLSFELPSTIDTIEDLAFFDCVNLLTVITNGNGEITGSYDYGGLNSYVCKGIDNSTGKVTYYYYHENGFTFKYYGGSYSLVAYVGDEDTVTLPDSYNGKPYTISSLKGVKNVIIPESITEIPDYAFDQCVTLESITLHDGVTYVGDWAFYYCYNLKNVRLSKNVHTIGMNAFDSCSALESITLPSALCNLESYAFDGCKSLKTVIFPEDISLSCIPSYLFNGCTSLAEIKLPEIIDTVRSNAFSNTAFYNNDSNWVDGILYIGDCLISAERVNGSECAIKEGTRLIAYVAFTGQSGIETLVLPRSLEIIGNNAFNGCDGIFEVYNNSNLPIVAGSDTYGGIAKSAYIVYDKAGTPVLSNGCSMDSNGFVFEYRDGEYFLRAYIGELESVTLPTYYKSKRYSLDCVRGVKEVIIPSGFTSISDKAFCQNKTLKRVTLPDTVTTVGNSAFDMCTSLEYINLPDSITSIGEMAFNCCTSLSGVDLPDGLTVISPGAFSSCGSLESIVIPDKVTEIGSRAFRCCSSLRSVYLPASLTELCPYAFYDCDALSEMFFARNSALSLVGMCAFPDDTEIALYCYSHTYLENYAETSNCDLYYVDLDTQKVNLKGISLVLDGNIGMRFYYEAGDSVARFVNVDAAVRYSDSHELLKYDSFAFNSGIEYDSDKKLYSVTVPIAPKDVGSVYVTASISYADRTIPVDSVSVSDYITAFREGENTAEAEKLIDALETYTEVASAYFERRTCPDFSLVDDRLDGITPPAKKGIARGVEHISTSLVLEGSTTIRHYFIMDTPEAIFVCNGERLTPIYFGEDIYYVDIPDISPDALDETFTVFVNGSLEISYSVLNYVKDAVASSNGSLVQLAMSLYNFHVSSRAYSDVY